MRAAVEPSLVVIALQARSLNRLRVGWLLGLGKQHFFVSAATEPEQCLHGGLAFGQCGTQLTATLSACTDDVLERDGLAGQFRVDRSTQEALAAARLIARVIANDHILPHVR